MRIKSWRSLRVGVSSPRAVKGTINSRRSARALFIESAKMSKTHPGINELSARAIEGFLSA
jgi:hypothetical protein